MKIKVCIVSLLCSFVAIGASAETPLQYQIFDIVRSKLFPDVWTRYSFYVSMDDAEKGEFAIAVDKIPNSNTPYRCDIYHLDVTTNPAVITDGKKKVAVFSQYENAEYVYFANNKSFIDKYNVIDYVANNCYPDTWKTMYTYLQDSGNNLWSVITKETSEGGELISYVKRTIELVHREGYYYQKQCAIVSVENVDNPDLSDFETVIVPFDYDVTYVGDSGVAEGVSTSYADVYDLDGVLVKKGAEGPHELDGLPAGVYIVGGKKQIKP